MGWLRDTIGRLGQGAAPRVPPGDPTLLLGDGAALLQGREFEAAADKLEQALALCAADDTASRHQAHLLLGRAYIGLERLAPASMHFEAAVQAKPDSVDALTEGARVLQELDSHSEAADFLQRLAELRPTGKLRIQLAGELRAAGRHEEAAEVLRQLCADEPRNIDAALMHHHVLVRVGRFQEALAEIDRVMARRNPDAAMLVNRSVPLQRLGRHDEALGHLDRALKLEPRHPRALANRAAALLAVLRVPEAVAAAQQGLRVHPENADLHWTLAAALLLQGDFQRGWAESEWRQRSTGYEGPAMNFDAPRWQGEDLGGRTIFLYPEQGIGDTIQFLRFVPEVARQARTVLLLVSPELEPLVAATLPANCRIVAQGTPLPAHDFECPLMSVPGVLGTTLENLPAKVPYLQAAPTAVKAWRKRLGADRLNVGICWSGNPRHLNDRHRSIELATFKAALDAQACRFVVLQPQKRPGDAELLAAWDDTLDAGLELRNFRDTAALIEALDLVITVDTSVAHLAGALGKPVWILLAHLAEWRWMLERTDSPWYPTARLYRQRALGDWSPVLASVNADLAPLAARRSS